MSGRLHFTRRTPVHGPLAVMAVVVVLACCEGTEPSAAPGRAIRLSISPRDLGLFVGEVGRLAALALGSGAPTRLTSKGGATQSGRRMAAISRSGWQRRVRADPASTS